MVNSYYQNFFTALLNEEVFAPQFYFCFLFKVLSLISSVSVQHFNEWPVPSVWFTVAVLPLILSLVSLRPE